MTLLLIYFSSTHIVKTIHQQIDNLDSLQGSTQQLALSLTSSIKLKRISKRAYMLKIYQSMQLRLLRKPMFTFFMGYKGRRYLQLSRTKSPHEATQYSKSNYAQNQRINPQVPLDIADFLMKQAKVHLSYQNFLWLIQLVVRD